MAQVIKNRWLRIVFRLTLGLILLFITLAAAIQFPYIQTKIVNFINTKFSEKIAYQITITGVAISWFDTIELQGVEILNKDQSPMITASQITIDFDISNLLEKSNHHVDDILINGADVRLKKVIDSSNDTLHTVNINDFIKNIKEATRKEGEGTRVYISCDHISLSASQFSYIDQFKDSLTDRFDYYHFTLDSINGEFDNIFTVMDTFGLDIRQLSLIEPITKLSVSQMRSKYSVSKSAMLFDNLTLKIGKSTIRDSIRFDYTNTADFSDFNNKVLLNASFKRSEIHTQDLKHFAPQLAGLNQQYVVSGDFNGLIRSFTIRNAAISLGAATTIRGTIRMSGLPTIDDTFIDFNLSNSYVTINDLKPYLKQKTFERLVPLERLSMNAEFLGYPNDFVAIGNFYTKFGQIDSDINLKLSEDISKAVYSGRLSMADFDLGGFFNSPALGQLTVQGNIKGSGFTLETADLNLNGDIEKIEINNYEYNEISTNARFTKEYFEGQISINDDNVKMKLDGSIDLRKNVNELNISAVLDTTNLRLLNLSKNDLYVKSATNINAKGLNIDDIVGRANFENTYLSYNNNSIRIDSLTVSSDKEEESRHIILNSNLMSARADGHFDLTQLYNGLYNLYTEYMLSIKNDSEETASYYSQKPPSLTDFNVTYEINIKDLNPLLEVFAPQLYVSPQSTIQGDFTIGKTSILSVITHFDSLNYNNDIFLNSNFQANISKISDSTDVLAMVFLDSEQQQISKSYTKNLIFEGIWAKDKIDFELDIEQQQFGNRAQLIGNVSFLTDTLNLQFSSAEFRILDKYWTIRDDNKVVYADKYIDVENFTLSNADQRITLSGILSEDKNDVLELKIDSLQLNTLNSIINKNIQGQIDGYARISTFFSELCIDNDLNIKNLFIDGLEIGDIVTNSKWDNGRKVTAVVGQLFRKGTQLLTLEGEYVPDDQSPLQMKAKLKGTELKIIEPFLSSYFTKIKGQLDGEIDITGTLTNPIFNGKGKISKSQIHINYLNTDYQFEGQFYLTPSKIGFSKIRLIDIDGQFAQLEGFIGHENFKNMYLNINSSFTNFQILNTTDKDNSPFYGIGEATGNLSFTGPLSNLTITANATTDKGTKIFIPIGESESIEQEDFITFTDLSKTIKSKTKTNVNAIDLRGIKLDFDLDITPDAYCEIIFDIKSGDIIRGRGNGDIKLEIDTKGEFNMFGDYNIREGGYNFTLYNLINKEFQILPNSKITWYGDPYQGILDISANYNQLASFLPLLSDQDLGDDFQLSDVIEIRRKYPVNVLLDIYGPLLSPTIDFDITSSNLPRNIQLPNGDPIDLEFEFLKFKNSIDEQELKRQVFSLIVLRKFSPLQSFNTGGSISSSVSELLSNQLSYWITQVDENLEIDVDFGKLDNEAFNTFQLRLSYSFFDGRLRVTRDGGFTNQANKADVSSIAGDWTVEYLLTDDGKFKVKMYNRTNYNPINPTEENQNTITTGFSLIHTQSFDEIKDLFVKKRKAIQEKDDQQQGSSKNPDNQANTSASLQKKDED